MFSKLSQIKAFLMKIKTKYKLSKFVFVMSVAVLQFIHSMMSEWCLFLYVHFFL